MALVAMDEVRNAVFNLASDSSPSIDGYSGKFYRACWDVISQDLLVAVRNFFSGVPLPCIVSSVQIVLLPKKLSPNTFADYRTTSLCNFLNKIFTRIICDRFGPLLPLLISDSNLCF